MSVMQEWNQQLVAQGETVIRAHRTKAKVLVTGVSILLALGCIQILRLWFIPESLRIMRSGTEAADMSITYRVILTVLFLTVPAGLLLIALRGSMAVLRGQADLRVTRSSIIARGWDIPWPQVQSVQFVQRPAAGTALPDYANIKQPQLALVLTDEAWNSLTPKEQAGHKSFWGIEGQIYLAGNMFQAPGRVLAEWLHTVHQQHQD